MKIVALLVGLVFIGLGVAGLAGMIAVPPMYSAVLAGSGVLFALYGLSRRRANVAQGPSGHDLRPWV